MRLRSRGNEETEGSLLPRDEFHTAPLARSGGEERRKKTGAADSREELKVRFPRRKDIRERFLGGASRPNGSVRRRRGGARGRPAARRGDKTSTSGGSRSTGRE
jgi:hypothetical protein